MLYINVKFNLTSLSTIIDYGSILIARSNRGDSCVLKYVHSNSVQIALILENTTK